MKQCDIVEKQASHKIQTRSNDNDDVVDGDAKATFINRQFPNSPLSLFSGIIPGELKVKKMQNYLADSA